MIFFHIKKKVIFKNQDIHLFVYKLNSILFTKNFDVLRKIFSPKASSYLRYQIYLKDYWTDLNKILPKYF